MFCVSAITVVVVFSCIVVEKILYYQKYYIYILGLSNDIFF